MLAQLAEILIKMGISSIFLVLCILLIEIGIYIHCVTYLREL